MKGRRRWPRPSFSLVAEADILAKVPVCITTARPVKTWKADTVTLLRRCDPHHVSRVVDMAPAFAVKAVLCAARRRLCHQPGSADEALSTHARPFCDIPRSHFMSGNATFTMLMSSTTMGAGRCCVVGGRACRNRIRGRFCTRSEQ